MACAYRLRHGRAAGTERFNGELGGLALGCSAADRFDRLVQFRTRILDAGFGELIHRSCDAAHDVFDVQACIAERAQHGDALIQRQPRSLKHPRILGRHRGQLTHADVGILRGDEQPVDHRCALITADAHRVHRLGGLIGKARHFLSRHARRFGDGQCHFLQGLASETETGIQIGQGCGDLFSGLRGLRVDFFEIGKQAVKGFTGRSCADTNFLEGFLRLA